MPYIDLTHTFKSTMPVFPGDSKPELKQVGFFGKDECVHFRVTTGMHVGTHIDAPSHMLENGKGLNAYSVDHFFGNGMLIDARGKERIGEELLEGKTLSKGDIVLILTGFSEKFENPAYFDNYPEITEKFARIMVERGVKIVGLDSASPDRSPYRVHKILLGSDILILENLTNLAVLLPHPIFEVIALPPKFDAEAAPVRVIAKV